MNWRKNNKPKHSNKKDKYRCSNCGFTAKLVERDVVICPSCKSDTFNCYGSKFRFSSKKRKNPCRIKRTKIQNALIHGKRR